MRDKVDIGLSVARSWFYCGEVGLIAIALAVAGLAKERDKVVQISVGSSTLTGKPGFLNRVQVADNTFALGSRTGQALMKESGDNCFFISADCTFGQALVDDSSDVVQAKDGKVLAMLVSRATAHPLGTTSRRS